MLLKENKIENNYAGLYNSFELEIDLKNDSFKFTSKEPRKGYGELCTALHNFLQQ
ncbi:MAG: hypothetical protein HRT47_08410 [Candidatus Caenarcaniphilales bacterium]|nr:hypothetical protein [Candidatus Caenarcaniphilales bacterium]